MADELIRPFSRACSAKFQARTLELVKMGSCRIIYATASASNGIDFVGIRRVIQYGLQAETMDFCRLVQRAGRCGRASDKQCLMILFVPHKYLLPRLEEDTTPKMQISFGKYREPISRPGSETMSGLYRVPFKKKGYCSRSKTTGLG